MFRGLQEFFFWLRTTRYIKKSNQPFKHIVQIGDPVLRKQSDPIPLAFIKSNEVKMVVDNLKDTMERYESQGLSAPQIGVNKRIILMEFNKKHKEQLDKFFFEREMALFPRTVIINPELKVTSYKKIVFEEGCESVRGFVADVPRYHGVQLMGFDENGEKIVLNLKGWLARIAQHEVDHLNGQLFTDIMLKETFHCIFWKEINDYRGKLNLTYLP